MGRDRSRFINVTGRDGCMGLNFGSLFLTWESLSKFLYFSVKKMSLGVFISKMSFNVLCK